MTFLSEQLVRFAHVDAAGIVFYPRYFEMLNAAVEDYFAEAVGVDFGEMHLARGLGVPTVRIETDFVAPSRLGDRLQFALRVARVGRSSMELAVAVDCAGEPRLRVQAVLVCMDLKTGRPEAWPADMRPQESAAAA